MKHKTFDFRTAYIDLLLNVLTGIIFLFVLTTLLIQPQKEKQDAGLKKNAEFVINIAWDKNIDCDVDIWVRDPIGNVASFKTKESGVMYIERDDLGSQGDYIENANNKVVGKALDNSETWVLRGLIEGKFTVNLHLYSCRKNLSSPLGTQTFARPDAKTSPPIIHYQVGEEVNVPVSVELIKLNPNYQLLKSQTVMLSRVWEEVTVFNFELNDKGYAYNFTKDSIKLIKVKEEN